jgi:hypothetical protein
MMKLMCAGVLASAMLLMGCQSANTSIARNSDGSYTVTRITAGFLKTYGSVHKCQASGASMTCTKLDSE